MRGRRPYVMDGDCYQVQSLEDGTIAVAHYPDDRTRRACCRVRVRITDADRAQAFDFEAPPGRTAALNRAQRAIDKKHRDRVQATA